MADIGFHSSYYLFSAVSYVLNYVQVQLYIIAVALLSPCGLQTSSIVLILTVGVIAAIAQVLVTTLIYTREDASSNTHTTDLTDKQHSELMAKIDPLHYNWLYFVRSLKAYCIVAFVVISTGLLYVLTAWLETEKGFTNSSLLILGGRGLASAITYELLRPCLTPTEGGSFGVYFMYSLGTFWSAWAPILAGLVELLVPDVTAIMPLEMHISALLTLAFNISFALAIRSRRDQQGREATSEHKGWC